MIGQDRLDGFALGVVLVLVTFALGLVIWMAAVRTQVERVDVRRWAPYLSVPTTTGAQP